MIEKVNELMKKDKINELINIINEIEYIDKYNIIIYLAKSYICMNKGQYEEAEIILLKGIIIYQFNFELIYKLAILYESVKDFKRSIYFYNKAMMVCSDINSIKDIKERISLIELKHLETIKNQIYSCNLRKERFAYKLVKDILECYNNYYIDNFDYERFGNQIDREHICRRDHFYISDNIERFCSLYSQLNDRHSKYLLTRILLFRLIGNKKIKLPLCKINYFKSLEKLDNLKIDNNSITSNFKNMPFYTFDITSLGYPIKLLYYRAGIYTNFILKQYEYQYTRIPIKINTNDIVIDAGGGYGDTALRFSYEVGKKGKIYSFEFVPKNLLIFEKNLNINKELSKNIEIIKKCIFDKSGELLFCCENGPGSKVEKVKINQDDYLVESLSIDDFVEQNRIERIDFIKMDIEGSELAALIGSENTLKKHKPKLAISIYHKISDFCDIIEFLQSLNIGYKFYLNHYTIHSEETILYAKVE